MRVVNCFKYLTDRLNLALVTKSIQYKYIGFFYRVLYLASVENFQRHLVIIRWTPFPPVEILQFFCLHNRADCSVFIKISRNNFHQEKISTRGYLYNLQGWIKIDIPISPWTYTQSFTPIVVQWGRGRGGKGWWNPIPRVFEMRLYFETILPCLKSLWSSQQDEVYFMGVGAAGGLWAHQQWSPSWTPPWTLPRIRNQEKTAIHCSFFVLDM